MESHFLSAQERVEWFEQSLQGLLNDRKSSTLAAGEFWYGRLASILGNVWTADSVFLWELLEPKSQEIRRFGSDAQSCLVRLEATDRRLLQLASERKGILWIEPTKGAAHWRAISRISDGVPLVVELIFRPSDDDGLSVSRDAILYGLEHNIGMLARYGGAFWCAQERLANLSSHVDEIALTVLQQRRALCGHITGQLRRLEGKKLATLEENQQLTSSVQKLLEENGLRLQCPTCGEPSIMRCLKTGNSPTGSFVFDHRIQGRRTMHGGRAEVPMLVVVDKAARKVAKVTHKVSIGVLKAISTTPDTSAQMS